MSIKILKGVYLYIVVILFFLLGFITKPCLALEKYEQKYSASLATPNSSLMSIIPIPSTDSYAEDRVILRVSLDHKIPQIILDVPKHQPSDIQINGPNQFEAWIKTDDLDPRGAKVYLYQKPLNDNQHNTSWSGKEQINVGQEKEILDPKLAAIPAPRWKYQSFFYQAENGESIWVAYSKYSIKTLDSRGKDVPRTFRSRPKGRYWRSLDVANYIQKALSLPVYSYAHPSIPIADTEISDTQDNGSRTGNLSQQVDALGSTKRVTPLPVVKEGYRFVAGDYVRIYFPDVPDYASTQNYMILPDGYLYLPYVDGGMKAAGLSISELTDQVGKKLKKYFKNPLFSIMPVNHQENTYTILGQIKTPGSYAITRSILLREALLQAGDIIELQYNQSGKSIPYISYKDSYIVRNGEHLELDFERLIKHNSPADNIEILPGDIIYIAAPFDTLEEIYVLGNISKPQKLIYRPNMNFAELMADLNENVAKKSPFVALVRQGDSRTIMFKKKVADVLAGETANFLLLPGDMVYFFKDSFQFEKELIESVLSDYLRIALIGL